jgi:hypothetical protein
MTIDADYAVTDRQWIQTYSGGRFFPLNPVSGDLSITDIAHALASKCRFTGHTLVPYSIAQHSVLVSYAVPPPDALWGLLHDATEAYLPDVARPIKQQLFVNMIDRGQVVLLPFAEAEDRLMQSICRRFGLAATMPESVKQADLRMLATERRDLMRETSHDWGSLDQVESYTEHVIPWCWQDAEFFFLQRFRELAGV